MEKIILASGSPRRQEYFRLMGLPFEVISSPVDESLDKSVEENTGALQAAESLALRKLNKVRELYSDRQMPWIVSADTLISMNRRIYGKPKDRDHARNMLMNFQGQSHEVISAVALFNGRKNTVSRCSAVSTVCFAPLSEPEIEWYLDTGEWEGVAGSYRIQGLAACFIREIRGSYSSVVGLPLHEFYVMLRDNGYPFGG